MTSIKQYLHSDLITFIDGSDRDTVINQLVDLLNTQKKLKDREIFYKAILNREAVVTTGIGMGVALPHAKLPDYNDFFITIAVLNSGVDWNSLDGTPVRLVFMIGGPDDKQNEYLKLLSNLTLTLKDEDMRKKMLTAKSPDAIMELFE